MMVFAGKMDRRITIERESGDQSGWGETTWTPVATVWAEKKHAQEDIQNTAAGKMHFEITTFRTRWFDDVTVADRIALGSEVYEIRGIRELGRRQGLEFKAKAWAGTDQR